MSQVQLSQGNRIVVRDAEWIVRSVEASTDRGFVIEAVGLSQVVKDQTMLFLTSLEDKITVLKPEETRLVTDLSGEYAHTRLYIETLLRKVPPTTNTLTIGLKGAMQVNEYQNDPARLALSEPRCRILIADAVGLGKTIEAGILITELIRRGRGKRILVLTLKSMLVQFQKEMMSRFSIPLVRLDSAGIQRIRNRIPSNYNPFYYYDKIIISIDTLKNENDYRIWLEDCIWDIIVIDEAHNVAKRGGHSLRARLAESLASCCDSMILLSATPHDGRRESFASLMNMLNPTAIVDESNYGPDDIRGLYIRRFKKDIQHQVQSSFRQRKIEKHTIKATKEEETIFDALVSMTFTDKNRFGRGGKFLFRTVLEKSLFSSPDACIETLKHRIATLEAKDDFAQQVKEIEELKAFLVLLEKFPVEKYSKYHKLIDLLTSPEYGWSPKNGNDRIVIFTERIKTLQFLKNQLCKNLKLKKDEITVIYGDMPDVDMNMVVEDFGKEQSPIRILLASDIAAEGINLHYLCHRLIHFDIPWSLMTFQQRNGRIDRYGQEQEPLISYLVTKSENAKIRGDMRILELLIEKDQEVHESIGDPSEFTGCYDEIEEETRTGEAMEQGLLPDLFEKKMKSDDDFFDGIFKNTAEPVPPVIEEPFCPVSLFKDDFSYYTTVFNALKEKHNLQTEYSPDGTSISITSPPGFAYREKFLPIETIPSGEPYLFSTDRNAVMKEIARCRKEEVAWPKCHLLWDMHPLMEWARDEIFTLFGRHQTPVVHAPNISINEHIFLVSASFSNQKGQIILHSCFGIYCRDNHAAVILELEEVMKKTGMNRKAIPNINTEEKKYPGLEAMLKEVVIKAIAEAKDLRKRFVSKTDVKLKEHYNRLDNLRHRKIQRLDDIMSMNSGTLTKRKQEAYAKEEKKINHIFDEYIVWIKEYMTISEDPSITIVCVFTGTG